MEEQGEFLIPASREEVWKALQDPEILKRCIDGCEAMTAVDSHSFNCVVAIKIGPVKAHFSGTIRMLDQDPPSRYSLDVNAQGGTAGFGNGRADVALEDAPEGTRLTYHAKGTIGGKLAQLGARLFQSFSRKMTRTFFERFSAHWVA